MKLTPEEIAAMRARRTADADQERAALRDNPPYERGGYAFYEHPILHRTQYVLADDEESPRCTECGTTIFADAYWLPDHCPLTDDRRHLYANGDKAFMFRLDVEIAIVTGEDYEI